jgi:hypothetical protein
MTPMILIFVVAHLLPATSESIQEQHRNSFAAIWKELPVAIRDLRGRRCATERVNDFETGGVRV